MTLAQILAVLRSLAPEETALPGDPVGLLVGDEDDAPVARIGVCLDATPDAAARAVAQDVQLVVAHHPLIYHPLKRLSPASDPIARAALTLSHARISLYAMHTNWDRAPGGINDTLAALLELTDVTPLGIDDMTGLPRIGTLPKPMTADEFAAFVGTKLDGTGTNALRQNAVGGEKTISRVAVCGGAGAELADKALDAGADAYVTSDVRHHEFLDAAARGLLLIDAGHDATETPGMRALAKLLTGRLDDVEIVWVGGG